MNSTMAQRNSIFFNKRSSLHFGKSLQQSKDNFLHFRRNCLVDKIVFKLDEKKLFEAEKSRALLHQYLILINKEKRLIKDIKHFSYYSDDNRANPKANWKQKQPKRAMKLLQRKKKKKEEKKKLKKQSANFLLGDKCLLIKKYDVYDGNWCGYLKDQIRHLIFCEFIKVNRLCSKLKQIILLDYKDFSHDSYRNELEVIRHFNRDIFKSLPKRTHKNKDNARLDDRLNQQMTIIRQKALLQKLNQKDQKYQNTTLHSAILMREITEDSRSKLKDNKDQLKEKDNILLFKGQTRYQMAYFAQKDVQRNLYLASKSTKPLLKNALKEDNHRFDFKRLIEFWMSNSDMLMQKKIREKSNLKEITSQDKPKMKVKRKNCVIKHIYSTPSKEIMSLIPFCSKKYTILIKQT